MITGHDREQGFSEHESEETVDKREEATNSRGYGEDVKEMRVRHERMHCNDGVVEERDGKVYSRGTRLSQSRYCICQA